MTQKQKLIILGTRAFAEEVADLVGDSDEYELVAFGENWERERCSRRLFGYPILYTTIGDYVTISPGANIAGCVTIGEGTYIGMGAIILSYIKIGSHSVVGAGAVVTKDVPDNVQVLGIPARITKENITGR